MHRKGLPSGVEMVRESYTAGREVRLDGQEDLHIVMDRKPVFYIE